MREKHGGRRHQEISPLNGRLPRAVFDADAAEEVPGVVVAIHAEMLEEALASLDEVEGVDGGLFQRVVIDVGGLSCWAYHWPESTEAFHRIQRWPRGAEL